MTATTMTATMMLRWRDEMPPHIQAGIYRLDTANGPLYLVSEHARAWIATHIELSLRAGPCEASA